MLILAVIVVLAVGAGAVYKFVLTGRSSGTNGTNNPSASPMGPPPSETAPTGPPTAGAPPAPATAGPSAGPTPGATTPGATTPTTGPAAPVGSAVVVPFTGLDHPTGVVADSDGSIYVADSGNNRVVKMPGGSQTQVALPFTDLSSPHGLASPWLGQVSVTDATTNRLLYERAPSNSPTPPWQATSPTEWVGPFTGLQTPHGVAIINNTYYVVDSGNNRVVKMAPGANAPDVVAFTGLSNPDGLAVVNTGAASLYVVDTGNNRVLNLADGFNKPQTVLAFQGLNSPHGVASYDGNSVYVTDTGNNQVVKLTTDRNTQATTQSILAFAGLNNPQGIAVDSTGNVYVVDSGNNRVLKLGKAFTG
jgi:DNA-binding beta-propeller fold protein YncE